MGHFHCLRHGSVSCKVLECCPIFKEQRRSCNCQCKQNKLLVVYVYLFQNEDIVQK